MTFKPYSYHGTETSARPAARVAAAPALTPQAPPLDIAATRAWVLYGGSDDATQRRDYFLNIFGMIRIAAAKGRDTEPMWLAAVHEGDTVFLAAYLEAVASLRRPDGGAA